MHWKMELWQQQGFASFGDWRRASEKARRAAKKAASKSATTALSASSMILRTAPATPPPASWEPLQLLQMPSTPGSPLRAADRCPHLPGKLHEHVQMTPHGSRAHTINHTSPGGTLRCEEYVSPAGGASQVEERNKRRLNLQAATRATKASRAAEAKKQAEVGNVHRYCRKERCEACATCLAPKRRKPASRYPCLTVLDRLEYTESERAIVLDPNFDYMQHA